MKQKYVPVVDYNQQPLTPTNPNKAARLIRIGKATPFWKHHLFCIRLNFEPTTKIIPDIVVGIDPGTKKEGLTVKSNHHTYFNFQLDTIDWVGDRLTIRRQLRHRRRQRKCPCRKWRLNRAVNWAKDRLPPSNKARWDWKLRIIKGLQKIIPINGVKPEDVAAKPKKGQRKWNINFSPVKMGKTYFYNNLKKICTLHKPVRGTKTKKLRNELGLKKLKGNKNPFYAHCVDSWVLANSVTTGHLEPDNTDVFFVHPIKLYRRQLHVMNPAQGGKRRKYGGTRSMGFKKGSIIKHKKFGICYIGGTCLRQGNERLALHNMLGERISRNAKTQDCKFLCYNSWTCY